MQPIAQSAMFVTTGFTDAAGMVQGRDADSKGAIPDLPRKTGK
jgi:hypothetical protein